MDDKGVVLLILLCFLIMLTTEAVDAATIDYLKLHSRPHVSGHMDGLSYHHDESFSDEFAFNGRAVLEDEKSDKFHDKWLSHVNEKMSLFALAIGVGIGFGGVVAMFILWEKAKCWVLNAAPPKPKIFYGLYRLPK